MAEWYVKELSQLTHVSVQTLHHYDRINLLKPSLRLSNGYRLYSESDLLKLQQIIALKFFGFELSKIKTLLSNDAELVEQLATQSHILHEQAQTLLEASQELKNIILDCSQDKSIPWKNIIKSIEVYRMVQQLKNSWEGKVFNSEELKKYAQFEQEKKRNLSEGELQRFKIQWEQIINEVNNNLSKDPESEFGCMLGGRTMDLVNSYYGREYVDIRNAVWNKGFKEGQIDHEHPLSPESFAWLDKSITGYYRKRIMAVLNQIGTVPHDVVLKQWEKLLVDMYGDEKPNIEIFNTILADNKVNEAAKNWVKEYMKK